MHSAYLLKTFIIHTISLIHPQFLKGQLETHKQLDKQPPFVDKQQIYVIMRRSHSPTICPKLPNAMSFEGMQALNYA